MHARTNARTRTHARTHTRTHTHTYTHAHASYLILGIPLYNVVMSMIADAYIGHYQRADLRQAVILDVSERD